MHIHLPRTGRSGRSCMVVELPGRRGTRSGKRRGCPSAVRTRVGNLSGAWGSLGYCGNGGGFRKLGQGTGELFGGAFVVSRKPEDFPGAGTQKGNSAFVGMFRVLGGDATGRAAFIATGRGVIRAAAKHWRSTDAS